jgi:hypothetical protein
MHIVGVKKFASFAGLSLSLRLRIQMGDMSYINRLTWFVTP